MSYRNDWSETIPIDHTKFKNMPGAVRTLREDIDDRLSNLFYGFISGETQSQEGVKALPYVAQTGDPGGVAGKISLYSKYATDTINYTFTVTSANATAGDIYSNNGHNYTVINTLVSGTTLQTNGSAAPLTSGTLTKVSGSGDTTITFASFSNAAFPAELFGQDEEDNVIQFTKNGSLNIGTLAIMQAILYVGIIIEEVTGVNPATTYGFGTWVLWGAGRVSVTVDITDYVFVITSGNATLGDTYTNNGKTFTVTQTIAGGLTLQTSGTGAPSSSGTLTKASGSGDSTLTFSTVSSDFGTVEATGGEKTHIQTIAELVSHDHDYYDPNTNDSTSGSPESDGGRFPLLDKTGKTGGGQAMNIMQPFITSYKWKRTA